MCSSGVHGTLVTGVGGSGTPPCAPAAPSSAQAGLSPATIALKNRSMWRYTYSNVSII